MTEASTLSLVDALKAVPDPRSRLGRRHPLPAVLALMAVATICGARSVYAILQWGRDQGREMAQVLGLDKHGIPTDGMMSNLLRRLDVRSYERALARWAATWPAEAASDVPQVINIDGKTLKGSQGHQVPAVHLLSAYAARLGIVLNQVAATADKEHGGEIIAAPQLLKGLVLWGKVITGDAIHAQRDLCRRIISDGGDYLLAVKENQPKLHAELVDLDRSPARPFFLVSKRTSTDRALKNERSV
jgi:hypothetical protein